MHILFDLDGTLTDSREGIARCYQHALVELGCPAPAVSALTKYVGPPLASCFQKLLQTDDPITIERAVMSYRRRFEERGMFENELYPGIRDALEVLSDSSHQLYVVTAKPRAYANTILKHFGIDRFFQAVYGPDFGQRYFTKGSLVETALKLSGIAAQAACLIGDRADDIAAATDNRLRAIGVTWGYGGREELTLAGADALVGSAIELVNYIQSIPGSVSAR